MLVIRYTATATTLLLPSLCLAMHRRTTRPPVTVVSPAKSAEPIEMPFGSWARVGSRNHVLDGAPDRRGNFRANDMPGHARRHSVVSCAKMAEPIEKPCGLWTRIGPRKEVLHGVLAPSGEYDRAVRVRPFCQITLTTC